MARGDWRLKRRGHDPIRPIDTASFLDYDFERVSYPTFRSISYSKVARRNSKQRKRKLPQKEEDLCFACEGVSISWSVVNEAGELCLH